jgi:hypothetical protein
MIKLLKSLWKLNLDGKAAWLYARPEVVKLLICHGILFWKEMLYKSLHYKSSSESALDQVRQEGLVPCCVGFLPQECKNSSRPDWKPEMDVSIKLSGSDALTGRVWMFSPQAPCVTLWLTFWLSWLTCGQVGLRHGRQRPCLIHLWSLSTLSQLTWVSWMNGHLCDLVNDFFWGFKLCLKVWSNLWKMNSWLLFCWNLAPCG